MPPRRMARILPWCKRWRSRRELMRTEQTERSLDSLQDLRDVAAMLLDIGDGGLPAVLALLVPQT
jgi:hypothetical protein